MKLVRTVKIEDYFPKVMSNAREFIDLANLENPEFDKIRKLYYKWFLNTFVYDLGESGANRWENMLHITPKITDSLERRKKRILARINAILPYTHRRLVEMLNSMYGEDTFIVELNYNEYELRIDLSYPLLRHKKGLAVYLKTIVPANLNIVLQNTKKAPQKIYVGTHIKKTKHYIIKTFSDFAVSNLKVNNFTGLYVRKAKYYKIGGL